MHPHHRCIRFVLCTDVHGTLGNEENGLLYQIPLDMARFKSLTASSVVAMGRRTWESLPQKPLRDRVCWVLSGSDEGQQKAMADGAHGAFDSVHSMLSSYLMSADEPRRPLYVIGGAALFQSILKHPVYRHMVGAVHWTRVDGCASAQPAPAVSTRSPQLDVMSYFDEAAGWTVAEEWSVGGVPGKRWSVGEGGAAEPHYCEDTFALSFVTLAKADRATLAATTALRCAPPPAELQYLALLRDALHHGHVRATRNDTTRSGFGGRVVVDLSDGTVPLLTTKRMAWKTVIKELLWFARGDTDSRSLQREKVGIWNGNASREFLDSRGLQHLREGDLGPVYGFQWRHAGAQYSTCEADYAGQGVDQLEGVRTALQTDPHSRRMIVSAWNPADLDKMALPPCHMLSQWYVDGRGRLWLQLYQRSGDMFLGVPFNLFSYAVLLRMMAEQVGREPGGMVHVLGDMHIYEGHTDVVKEQLGRCPYAPPRLSVKGGGARSWEAFELADFELQGYQHGPGLQAPMVA